MVIPVVLSMRMVSKVEFFKKVSWSIIAASLDTGNVRGESRFDGDLHTEVKLLLNTTSYHRPPQWLPRMSKNTSGARNETVYARHVSHEKLTRR
jgi:hypothetical protein